MKTKEQKQNRNFLIANVSVILFLIAMAISSGVSAQPPGGQQGPPPVPNSKQIKKMVKEISSELSLSEKQQTEMQAMYEDHFSDVKKATSSGRPDRNKMEALESSFQKKVNATLNDEQQKLYAAYLKKNKRQQQRGRPE